MKNIFFFLPLLIPSLLITGPFLPDFFLVLTCLYFLLDKNFINFTKIYLKNREILIYLSLLLLAVVSSLFSDHVISSLKSSLFHIRFILFALIFFYLSNRNQKFVEYQLTFLLATLYLLNLDAFLQLFTGKNILGFELKEAYILRPTSFFADDLKLGSYLAKFSLFLLALSFYIKKFIKSSLIIVLFSWVLIYFSGERTSFILFSLSAITLSLIFSKFINKKDLKILIVSVVIALSLLSYKTIKEPKYFNKMLINPLKELSIIGEGQLLPAHRKHYEITLEIFKENILIGAGPNTFRYECKKIIEQNKNIETGCSTHPHNLYLQLLSETGIFGFLIAIYFYLRLFLIFINNILNIKNREFKSNIIINTLLLMTFFPLAPTGNIFNNWYSITVLFSLGFFLHLRNKIRNV